MFNGKNITVAYVEDEPSIATLLASGLKLFGIAVRPIYMSSEDLLDSIGKDELAQANLLFFDIRLPKMTGLELAGKLREMGETRPIVLVSAWPRPDEALLTKIKARFLPKPFDFPDIIKTIQQLTAE